mmetsp:Transcript_41601/g.90708  ORF Transcript_41601/g.90708 Transcript_41601/m.90708 type:complete len:247 (-) Transcript_41601:777-1517(-)
MDIHEPEVDAVAHGGPGEAVRGPAAGNGPADAHHHVPDVVEVPGEAPVARGEQVAALLSSQKLSRLAPDEVLGWILALGYPGAEVVFLNVGDSEQVHSEDVDQATYGKLQVIACHRRSLEGEVAEEGEGVVPGQESHAAVGEHPPVEVVPDVSCGEVGGLVPVVVQDIIPMGQGDHDCCITDAAPVTRCIAGGGSVLQLAAIVHRGHVGLIADDPHSQPRPGVGEALHVERHLQQAMENPRIPGHA